MVLAQRASAEGTFQVVPPVVASAATRYQRARALEKHHLAIMGRHDLLADWTDDVREMVLAARERIYDAQSARAEFRAQISTFVSTLRAAGEPLPTVLRHTRSMMQLLERSGALDPDGGWLEAEILEWAIAEYEAQ
jgi:hypothetical protein